MSTNASTAPARPANVPADRVIDFDIYTPLKIGEDFHQFWSKLQHSGLPSVVWTPHNGGHWIALTGKLVAHVLADYENFSNHTVLVPKDTAGEAYRLIPLSLDPPEHRPFRTLLNDNLSPKGVRGIEESIRALTIELIEGFRKNGHCNFTREFAEQLPVKIFMQVVDLPMKDLPKLKHLADQFTRPDGSLEYKDVVKLFHEYIGPVIKERRKNPGNDMVSRMVNGRVNDRPLTDEEAANICIQVLVGGLDTVVNFMGFTMLYLAKNPAFRQMLVDDPSKIPEALEEFVRRFPLVASAREVRRDFEFEGVQLKKGEMMLAPSVLHGIDETENDHPFDVRLGRSARRHTTFGTGSHSCPGAYLARTEVSILLEEWLKRIPQFKCSDAEPISYTSGVVGSVNPFVLEWAVTS